MDPLPEFDDCRVIERLRSGPVADLYHAVQEPLGRAVLIKALSSSILPSSPFAAVLEREARLLAELHHPNIPHLYDFVRRSERMWLVLEYTDGFTLEELLEARKPFPSASVCAIALEVARALEHAHERGVVHRDIQPRNILVSRTGEIKLVSFSVAVDGRLPTAPELLDGRTPFGGPAYMSPEQILGEPPDPRSDLFSLGVLMYELISGKRPFDGPDERSVTQRIRHDPPLPLPRDQIGLPASLERTILRCLEKLPSDRFATARELAIALQAIILELGGGSERQIIASSLAGAGLVAPAPASRSDESKLTGSAVARRGFGGAVRGFIVCFVLIVLGGGVIQYLATLYDDAPTTRGGTAALPLLPQRPGYLRVVADPWADVIVDGQKLDTTPFARAIPLSAGAHYVRLEHPNALTERRTIRLVPGETILLDVKMTLDLEKPASSAAEQAEAVPDAATDAPPSP